MIPACICSRGRRRMIGEKLPCLIEVLSHLARPRDMYTDLHTKEGFANSYGDFCHRKGLPAAHHKHQAREMMDGNVYAPHLTTRNLLSEFFTEKARMLPSYSDVVVPESLFQRSPDMEHFRKELETIFHTNLPYIFEKTTPFTLILPPVSQRRVDGLIEARLPAMRGLFSGWKIVYRMALENTGRVCREVVKFDIQHDRQTYEWWFQTEGGLGRENRRVNAGAVIPFQNSYVMLGVHDSQREDQFRFRMAVIQQKPPNAAIDPVQTGLVVSTNARDFYPVTVRMLWVTIPTDYVGTTSAAEMSFLDKTVGFFRSISESFSGSELKGRAIEMISNSINNNIAKESVLSVRNINDADVLSILSEDWKAIIASFTGGVAR
jgi:hypothetical protein